MFGLPITLIPLVICAGVVAMAADIEILPERSFWSSSDPRAPEITQDGSPMAFALATVATSRGMRPLLFATYVFPDTFADRFSRQLPAPIFVVAVNRATGTAYMRELTRDDDPPVTVNSISEGLGSVWRVDGKVVDGPAVRIGGRVTVDIMAHLGLPPRQAIYDVFLWIDQYATEMQEVVVTGTADATVESSLHRRPDSIVTWREAQAVVLEAAIDAGNSGLVIRGRSPGGPVTLLAVGAMSRRIGWSRIADAETAGLEFSVPVRALIGEQDPDERLFGFAFARGVRSQLLDSQPPESAAR